MAAIHQSQPRIRQMSEIFFAVNKINMLVSGLDSRIISGPDHSSPLRVRPVAPGQDQDRQIGLRFPDDTEKFSMSFFQMFVIGGVVVIIHHKGRQFQTGNGFRNCGFAFGIAGKTQIDLFGRKFPAENGGVIVPGMRSTAALRNGTAVEKNGLIHLPRGAFGQFRMGFKTDLHGVHSAVKGQVDQIIPHLTIPAAFHQSFKRTFIPGIVGRGAGNAPESPLAVIQFINIHPGTAVTGHVIHIGKNTLDFHRNILGIGPEADRSACSTAGKALQIGQCFHHRFRKTVQRLAGLPPGEPLHRKKGITKSIIIFHRPVLYLDFGKILIHFGNIHRLAFCQQSRRQQSRQNQQTILQHFLYPPG